MKRVSACSISRRMMWTCRTACLHVPWFRLTPNGDSGFPFLFHLDG